MSHPARGAWIEMIIILNCSILRSGRTPHGVRGLKYQLSRGNSYN